MANTTNYNWETPDDTDLVKDGAAAIRTLGSSIDTTTKNLNPQTTTGALAYRSATANVNTALPIGTAGQVLRVNSGATAPEWATTADQTPLTTKGDLFGFDTADARIPIGTNGHILTADSTQALGLKWAAAAAGGLPNSTSFTATPTGFAAPGALVTRYVESGDSVFYYGRIDFDSSTTYSGNFTLNLPATASMSGGARFQGLGQCFISDSSTGIDYSGYSFIPTTTSLIFGIPKTSATYLSDIPSVANGTPISFANNDQLYFFIWYRKA